MKYILMDFGNKNTGGHKIFYFDRYLPPLRVGKIFVGIILWYDIIGTLALI